MNFSKERSGQLLLEMLVAIAISAVVLAVGGTFVFTSLRSNQISDEKDTAIALANETTEAVRAAAFGNWPTLYAATHSNGGSAYYPSRISYYVNPAGASENATQVSVGGDQSCAPLTNSIAKCWGRNADGGLGDGTTTERLTPVSVCADSTCASSLSGAIQVSSGESHACARLSDSTIKCWGFNGDGGLGDGTTTERHTPVSVCADSTCVSSLSGATQISSGGSHTCAVLSDSTIKCWGDNQFGELGDGTTTDRHTPVIVLGIVNATQVSAGRSHTCAVLSDNTIKCWGDNQFGQLGNGTLQGISIPTQVLLIANATQVYGGTYNTCARLSDSTIKCWGRNDFGQVGDGTTDERSTPVAVSGISNATQVSSGGFHTCAALSDGTIKCWGRNADGRLGDGTTTERHTPVSVCADSTCASSLSGATQVSTAFQHSCAALSDSTIKCWGDNQFGELGDGTTTERHTPVSTSLLYNSNSTITDGSYHWVSYTPADNSTRWGNAQTVNGVSALSPKNIWVVADNLNTTSNVWQYNGDTWTQRSPTSTSRDFYAVEAISNNNVWVGGEAGNLWNWDGSTWTNWSTDSPKCNTGSTNIMGISASSSSNVWMVGASGNVWKTDGATCTLVAGDGAPTGNLLGVSATSSTNIWTVGPSGKVYSYDGSWHEHSGDAGVSGGWNGITMNSVSVLSATNVWIAGTSGNVWNYNGTSWTSHTPSSGVRWGNSNSIKGITAFSPTWIVIEGASGQVWENTDGTTTGWTVQHSGLGCQSNPLCNAGLSSTTFSAGAGNYSTEMWVAGASGNLWKYKPTEWQITSGTESKQLGTNTFTRSFYVQHVCRDNSLNIKGVTDSNGVVVGGPSTDPNYQASPCDTSGGSWWDPSTEKITVTVSWTGGQTITSSSYVARWKNTPCLQTQWVSTDTGTTTYLCPSTVYNNISNLSLATNTQVVISLPVVNASGTLTSAIFDSTGITSRGSGYNSIMWRGNALTGSQKVQFQIGVYDNDTPSTGTLTYYGATGGMCNSSNWFDPGAPDTPIDIKDCASNLNNKRYFVYKLRLCGSATNSSCSGIGVGATSPTVTDIVVNTSP